MCEDMLIISSSQLKNDYYKAYKNYQESSSKEVKFNYGKFLGVRTCIKSFLPKEQAEKIFSWAVLEYARECEEM